MKSDKTIRQRRAAAHREVNSRTATVQSSGNQLWRFVDSVASGLKEAIGQPITEFAKAVDAHASALKWLVPIQWRVGYALAVWVINDVERKIEHMIVVQVSALKRWTFGQLRDTYYLVAVAIATLRVQLTGRITAETHARIVAVRRADAQAKAEVRALHHAIEHEAASAYASGQPSHFTAMSIVGDAIGAAEPALKDVVSRVIQYAVDLAEIDNPVLRFLAGKLLAYLIDKLGIDKILGEMLAGLALPIAHLSAPKGVPEVVTLLCGRIGALEQFDAQFMADGGPEVLRAGEQWRNIDTVETSVEVLAFFGTMVAAPSEWADTVAGTLGVVVNDTISAFADLIRKA